MKPFQIFRAGTHTAANGEKISFSEDDLKSMAAAYDPGKHEAPIVVGHPKDNAPAYGWIRGLSYSDDGTIEAEGHQITDQFAEWLQAGHYKKRSASLYPPEHLNNPSPGAYYLRHVGFLGAQAPAIKGMPDAEFKDDDGALVFTDPQYTAGIMARLLRGMREWMIGKEGLEEADKVLPGWLIEDMEAEARAPDPVTEPAPGFSEGDTGDTPMNKDEELKQQQDKLKADQDALAAQQADFAEKQNAFRRRDITSYLDTIVAAGKLAPAHKAGMAEFMAGLDQNAELEFGEGDNKKKATPEAWLREFLESQPKIIAGGEHSGDDGHQDGDTDPADLADKAVAYQEAQRKAGIDINIEQAVSAVQAGKAG